MAVLYPSMFMLRRVIYAAILVSWIQRNYFQIQAIVFKTSLFLIYVGYFRPHELPLENKIELFNESLV